jgi:hypothetical protein
VAVRRARVLLNDEHESNWPWDSIGGGDHDHDSHDHDNHVHSSSSQKITYGVEVRLGHDSCETPLENNEKYLACINAPADCTELCVARHPACCRLGIGSLNALWWEGPCCEVRAAEYGGGGGGERRDLTTENLCGTLPSELGTLASLTLLCVHPHPTTSLSNVGLAAHPREARWTGEQVLRVVRRVFT